MAIDYNILAQDYDLTRTANISTLNRFAEEIALDGKVILDFGCGTGNFTFALTRLTTAKVYGAEPSDGMREKALAKGLDVRKGNHTKLPFEDNFFDFIYMTDVVHHVPDVAAMFAELRRVCKHGGLICILTESHEQLATRFWVKHFPATVAAERARYPDIPVLVAAAETAGLMLHKRVETDAPHEAVVSEDFVRLVENKGYTMFRLITDAEYQTGLAALRADCESGVVIPCVHGETLLWLRKGGEA